MTKNGKKRSLWKKHKQTRFFSGRMFCALIFIYLYFVCIADFYSPNIICILFAAVQGSPVSKNMVFEEKNCSKKLFLCGKNFSADLSHRWRIETKRERRLRIFVPISFAAKKPGFFLKSKRKKYVCFGKRRLFPIRAPGFTRNFHIFQTFWDISKYVEPFPENSAGISPYFLEMEISYPYRNGPPTFLVARPSQVLLEVSLGVCFFCSLFDRCHCHRWYLIIGGNCWMLHQKFVSLF